MPKEQINTPANRVVTQMDDGGYALRWMQDGDPWPTPGSNSAVENSAVVRMGWAPATDDLLTQGAVLEMVVSEPELRRALAEIDRCRALVLDGQLTGPFNDWTFHTIVLTRPELQKLIRTARRARDAVFGGDE